MKTTQPTNIHSPSANANMTLNEPDECPICHHAIKPEYLASKIYSSNIDNSHYFSALYLCKHCYGSFIVNCKVNRTHPNNHHYEAIGNYTIAPIKYIEEPFEPFINEVSPNFVEIYNQAIVADSYDLYQISGIGLRKALEFLIKDFLISEDPSQEEIIKEMNLGKCIQDKIDNPQLKTVAQRATWLGNDHTHYVQKYEDKDIEDLKRLIRLSVHWISLIQETKEAEAIEKK